MKKALTRAFASILLAGAVLLCTTGIASAAATTVVDKTGGTITVTSSSQSSQISIRMSGDRYRISNPLDVVIATGECTQVSAHEASCPAFTTTEIVIRSGT